MAERTKLWIAEAMRRLMSKQTLERIRVTEICREAKIGRPAFYYNFKDKYDLVAWMFCYRVDGTDIISVELGAESMRQMKRELVFYKRIYEDFSQNAMWLYMVEYFVNRYTDAAKDKLKTDVLDAQLAYSIRFYCMGAVGMTREWVMSDNTTPAKTVVTMMFNSMPQSMRNIFFGTEKQTRLEEPGAFMVGEVGFEPTQPCGNGFTVRPF